MVVVETSPLLLQPDFVAVIKTSPLLLSTDIAFIALLRYVVSVVTSELGFLQSGTADEMMHLVCFCPVHFCLQGDCGRFAFWFSSLVSSKSYAVGFCFYLYSICFM